jgi:hypothetical protein
MTPLLRKEIRLLLPTWVAALLAATTPLWWWREGTGMLPAFIGLGVLGLSLSSFGQEMSHGTFGLLLVQPVERRILWRIKFALLILATVSAWGLFAVCLALSDVHVEPDGLRDWFEFTGLLSLLGFAGGLWSTILLREVVTSFFCACLVPAFVAVLFVPLTHWIDSDSNEFAVLLFGGQILYAIAGIIWARKLFLSAQDTPWTGGQISLTRAPGFSLRWLSFEIKARQNRWAALIKKELQLQEITMILVPVLALLHLLALTAGHLYASEQTKDFYATAVPFIWLAAVPVVIGCAAVAEERRLNTLESLLCLPISKAASFGVKLVVALVLGVVLGGIIPSCLLDQVGNPPMGWMMVIAAAITGTGFYASTLSRGLLQALPVVILMPLLEALLCGKMITVISPYIVGNNCLLLLCETPAITLTLGVLAFVNYKSPQITSRALVRNLVTASAAMSGAALLAAGIFDRAWEWFLPAEPLHGPAQIAGSGRAALCAWLFNSRTDKPRIWDSYLGACLPDGRLWIGKRTGWTITSAFIPGTNWTQLVSAQWFGVALRSDGTLWDVQGGSNMSQIGHDSDWKSISAGNDIVFAIKQDGTLWSNRSDPVHRLVPAKKNTNDNSATIQIAKVTNAFTGVLIAGANTHDKILTRINSESNWVQIFPVGYEEFIGLKADGTSWKWGQLETINKGTAGLWRHTVPASHPWPGKIDGTNWVSMAGHDDLVIGIRLDGTMWIAGDPMWQPRKLFGVPIGQSRPQPDRLGSKSDWVDMEGSWYFSAIDAEGTLWSTELGNTKQPSQYHDWIATAQQGDQTMALARDGTLSSWQSFGQTDRVDDFLGLGQLYLGPSHRPVYSLNIFEAGSQPLKL